MNLFLVMAWKEVVQRCALWLIRYRVESASVAALLQWWSWDKWWDVGVLKTQLEFIAGQHEHIDNYCRAATIQTVNTATAWWEPAWDAVPTARVSGGYLQVMHSGSHKDATNIVWAGAASGAIEASQVSRTFRESLAPGQSRRKWRESEKSWWEGSKSGQCHQPLSARGDLSQSDACPKLALKS